MNKEDLRYFKLISRLQSAVGKSESYYDAVRNGIKVILEQSCADYAVVWHCEGAAVRPYYWLAPVDLSSVSLSVHNSVIDECMQSGKAVAVRNFDGQAPAELKQILQEMDALSLVITPFSFGEQEKGLIFYISCKAGFTEDDVNVFEILSMLAEMSVNESPLPFKPLADKEILMTCRSICKSFKNGETVTNVLKGINIDVFEGEFLCLLGESGCGKSTLLNIIGGLERADSGTFEFMGTKYTDASEDELTEYRRKNIGFVFQSYNLMPNLTAKQNLDLIAELAEDPMNSEKALETVGLGEKADSYPAQLSGGQQQRVSIARAIVKNPKLIMADEPTAALDYRTSLEVLQVFSDIVNGGTTLIMVTHNEEITKMADRVIRFRDGRVYEVTVNRNPKRASELVW